MMQPTCGHKLWTIGYERDNVNVYKKISDLMKNFMFIHATDTPNGKKRIIDTEALEHDAAQMLNQLKCPYMLETDMSISCRDVSSHSMRRGEKRPRAT